MLCICYSTLKSFSKRIFPSILLIHRPVTLDQIVFHTVVASMAKFSIINFVRCLPETDARPVSLALTCDSVMPLVDYLSAYRTWSCPPPQVIDGFRHMSTKQHTNIHQVNVKVGPATRTSSADWTLKDRLWLSESSQNIAAALAWPVVRFDGLSTTN